MSKPRTFVAVVALVVLTIPTVASAGKPERDRQKELEPKVAEARATLKSKCGCDVAVSVKWDSYKKADDMFRVPEGIADAVTASVAHCVDATERKAFCANVSTFEMVFDGNGAVVLTGKKITCGTSDSTHCGDHQIKAVLDKF